MLGQSETLKHFQHRFPVLMYVIAGCFGLLTLRLVQLQLLRGSEYRQFSERNSLRREKLPGPRGQIFDRTGRILVDNRLQLNVVVTPQFVGDPKAVMTRLAEISGEKPEKLLGLYKEKARISPPFQPITIIANAPWSVIAQIESFKYGLSGVDIESRIRRTYLQGDVGAHVYGYISEVNQRDLEKLNNSSTRYESGDFIGRTGIERQFEDHLRGQDGVRFVVVNAHGHRVMGAESVDASVGHLTRQDVPPQPGNNLVLTIDADLQEAAAEAMTGKMGATVALDPRTGEVLAMISKPSFQATSLSLQEPGLWESLIRNPYGPLRNKAIQDFYSPGSTFKVFTALAALENGAITPETVLSCPPVIRFGNRPYHDHNQNGFGKLVVSDAIKVSSNVFLWQLAMRLSVDQIAEVANDFGLGQKTGIDLPNESAGLMPTESWKQKRFKEPWFAGETLSVAIGQGAVVTTPLQMAVSYGAIANDGLVYQPYVVSKIQGPDGSTKIFKPKLLHKRKSDPRFIGAIKEGLFKVINVPGGTAYHYARMADLKIAGKSGTVQTYSKDKRELFTKCDHMPFERRNHAWFVAYAPAEKPEIVVASFGMHECAGSRAIAPIVKAVIQKWWEKKKYKESIQGPQPASVSESL